MGTETDTEAAAPPGRERTDAELVRAHQEGDVRAFEELHRRYVGSIYRLVRRKLGDGLLAEDIAQETFLKSLKTMHRVDEDFNFGGWIHTVARNLCLDELRRRQRDPRAEDTGEGELLGRLPAPSSRSDPVVAYENAELRDRVWKVASLLPEKYRLVLTLRELQGLPYRQIGKVMQISESAVETLLYRARIRFKEEFLALQARDGYTCADVQPLLAPFQAGKLRRAQADAVAKHLEGCPSCSALLREPADDNGRSAGARRRRR
jgi:RNA polymerase sigma-70 factor (ECF subfamily)